QDLGDDSGRDCDKGVVGASLNPVVSARWGAEMMAAPVIDHVVPVAIFGRQAVPPIVLMVRTHAATFSALLFVCASEAVAVMPVCRANAVFRRPRLPAASVSVALREGELPCGHRQCDDGGNGGFAGFHLNLT